MDEKTLWQQVQEELKVAVSKAIFQTLISKTHLVSLEKDIATVACHSHYILSLIEGRYYSLIKSALDHQTSKNNSLVFTVQPQNSQTETKTEPGPLFEWQETKTDNANIISKTAGLNPKYTFLTFVVGNSNNFAYAAALAIVQNPGTSYNPFFVWGGVGVGKTHLIQAVGHAILEKHPDYKILYFPAETFTNDLVQALQNKTMTAFKNKYRTADVLLIDDIQFIASKEFSQEEFFHTFNVLYLSGKQIILTSDRRPEEIPKIEARLTSRFMGGLTVDVQPPDFEMRVAILKARCQARGCLMDEQAIAFLAQMIDSNTRELEGTLSQIITQSSISGQEPSLDFIRNFFGIKNKTRAKNISPKTILSAVSEHFKTKPSDILGASRRKELVLPRQIIMYLMREETTAPLEEIGEILGGRDHTTVLHGVKKIEQKFTSDSNLRREIMLIKQTLYE